MNDDTSLTHLRLVLRFRDLEVTDTIAAHVDVIERHGYVWWGWWDKPGEVVPRRAMLALENQLRSEPSVEIFLVDSGSETLYTARLTALVVSPTEQKVVPDLGGVPGYYYEEGRDPARKIWFRLDSIVELPTPDTLRGFSYVELPWDEFTDDPTSGAFDGKRVAGVEELLQRVRTMWFLRPARAEDRANRVAVETPAEEHEARVSRDGDTQIIIVPGVSPAPFVLVPVSAPRSHILIHLSDLHFGPHHGFPYVSNVPAEKNLALRMIDDLRKLYDVPPIAVILSGDLTWSGAPEEFELAREFVDELSSAFKLTPNNFVAVPGNHDIRWAKQKKGHYDPAKKVDRPPKEAEANFRQFIRDTLMFEPNADLSMGRRYTTTGHPFVDVIGLNSSQLEQERFAGHGLVTEERFLRAANEMAWLTEEHGPYTLRFVVLHHHLLPVVPREEVTYGQDFSTALDASEILVTALRCNVDLALHGHMHQPVASTYARNAPALDFPPARTICVHGAGSAGLKRDHLGPIGRNSYTIYEVSPNKVRVRIRATSEATEGGYDEYSTFALNLNGKSGGLKMSG